MLRCYNRDIENKVYFGGDIMEVLAIIMMVVIYFLLDRSEDSSQSNSLDFIDEK